MKYREPDYAMRAQQARRARAAFPHTTPSDLQEPRPTSTDVLIAFDVRAYEVRVGFQGMQRALLTLASYPAAARARRRHFGRQITWETHLPVE